MRNVHVVVERSIKTVAYEIYNDQPKASREGTR